jgi:hypothetical protein
MDHLKWAVDYRRPGKTVQFSATQHFVFHARPSETVRHSSTCSGPDCLPRNFSLHICRSNFPQANSTRFTASETLDKLKTWRHKQQRLQIAAVLRCSERLKALTICHQSVGSSQVSFAKNVNQFERGAVCAVFPYFSYNL